MTPATRRPDLPRPIPNSYTIPGTRLAAGEYPGSPPGTRVVDADAKIAAFLDAGIDAFVDLTDPADALAPYHWRLGHVAGPRGIDVAYDRLSIPDMDVCDAAHMRAILDTIDERLAEGRTVYVHCWGGIGRTGTVVGCWLVRRGMGGEEALAEVGALFGTMSADKVRRHPEGSPQTEAQREMVRGWTAHERRVA